MRLPLVLLAGLWGCSTDTFGSDGGTDAATDTSIGDVVVADAPHVDGGGPSDATSTDASTLFSCNPAASGTILCDDFESSSNVAAKWLQCSQLGGGTCALDTNTSISPTHSAIFQAPPASSTVTYGALYAQGSVMMNTMSIQSEIRIHAIDASVFMPLMVLSYAAGNEPVSFDVAAASNGLVLIVSQPTSDGGLASQTSLLATYMLDRWTNVRLVITVSQPVAVMAYVDESLVLMTSYAVPLPNLGTPIRDFEIGIVTQESTSLPASVDFDNFLFRQLM